MNYIKTPSSRFTNSLNIIALSAISFLCLYPVLYVLFASFSDPILLAKHRGFLLFPLNPTLEGYKIAFGYDSIWRGYLVTVYIVVVGTSVNMILTIMAAYVLSKKELYLYRFLNIFVTFTMFFSGGLIPTYLVVKNMGLIDSLWALIIPGAVTTWNLIILRTAIDAVPKSLEESARIDGASEVVILTRIIIPVVKATLAVLALYYIVGHWNSWFSASLYIKTRTKFPLQLILREVLISNTSNEASVKINDTSQIDQYKRLVKYCTTIIATVPILFIYPFLQKYFVKGVMVGAVKG